MQEQDSNKFQGATSNMLRAQQKFIADVLTEKPVSMYAMDDYPTMRKALFDNVKDAVARRFPLYNDRYTLSIENVDYDDPEDIGVDKQKDAIMQGKSVTRRLRGNWVLRDAATDKVVSKTKRMTLASIPYMTDRGSFIRNGHEYCFTNILRLEPGVYAKEKPDGIEAQFNIRQGTGSGFRMRMLPKTGVFQMSRGTQNAPAYTVFKDMGITDDQLREAWGDELFEVNKQAGSGEKARIAADRIYNNDSK